MLSGSSSGGWLSLLCASGIGFEASGIPKLPAVLGNAAIYPITDLEDPFWTTPQRPVSYFPRIILKDEVQPFIDPTDAGSRVAFAPLESQRSMFYHYMLQE